MSLISQVDLLMVLLSLLGNSIVHYGEFLPVLEHPFYLFFPVLELSVVDKFFMSPL